MRRLALFAVCLSSRARAVRRSAPRMPCAPQGRACTLRHRRRRTALARTAWWASSVLAPTPVRARFVRRASTSYRPARRFAPSSCSARQAHTRMTAQACLIRGACLAHQASSLASSTHRAAPAACRARGSRNRARSSAPTVPPASSRNGMAHWCAACAGQERSAVRGAVRAPLATPASSPPPPAAIGAAPVGQAPSAVLAEPAAPCAPRATAAPPAHPSAARAQWGPTSRPPGRARVRSAR
jgi:hypothetical protein